jgi:hypothetical protein
VARQLVARRLEPKKRGVEGGGGGVAQRDAHNTIAHARAYIARTQGAAAAKKLGPCFCLWACACGRRAGREVGIKVETHGSLLSRRLFSFY